MQMNHKLIKIGQASKILGVSIDTLRRWEANGKLSAIKTPGGTRLYSLTELQTFKPVLYQKSSPDWSFFRSLTKINILTLSFIITPLITIFTVIGIYLSLPNSTNLSAPFTDNQTMLKGSFLAQAATMDNTYLNQHAQALESETVGLVAADNLDLKPAINMAITSNLNNLDNSWTITSEDCVRDIIERGI
jgi:excisionase family DNA binding protein